MTKHKKFFCSQPCLVNLMQSWQTPYTWLWSNTIVQLCLSRLHMSRALILSFSLMNTGYETVWWSQDGWSPSSSVWVMQHTSFLNTTPHFDWHPKGVFRSKSGSVWLHSYFCNVKFELTICEPVFTDNDFDASSMKNHCQNSNMSKNMFHYFLN